MQPIDRAPSPTAAPAARPAPSDLPSPDGLRLARLARQARALPGWLWAPGAPFTARETRACRALSACAAIAILLYGVVYGVAMPHAVDPWWQRLALAAACTALAAVPWAPGQRVFRASLYAVVGLITAWVVNLLWRNGFAGEYDIGLLMTVSLIGGVIRSPRALVVYSLGTIAAVLGIAAVIPSPRLSPLLFVSKLVTVLAVFLAVAGERRRAEVELAASEGRYRLLFDASPRPLWVHDVDSGRMLAVNDAALRHYGYARPDFLARTMRDLQVDDRPAPALDGGPPDDAAVDGTDGSAAVWRHRTRHGATRDMEITAHPIAWDGRGAQLVLATDVTAQRRLAAELQHRALHDPLTDLANRSLFRSRVEAALARAGAAGGGADGAMVAVLFLDLDNFKTVNDSLGHGAGDELLTHVARRLLHATRGCDAVARLGGDEFAVLLDEIRHPDESLRVAARILEALDRPLLIAGTEVRAHASVGIATSAHADAAEALLRDADMAMYRAKTLGKGQACLFEPAMHAAALTRLQLEAELRRTVEQQPPPAPPAPPALAGGAGRARPRPATADAARPPTVDGAAGSFHLVYQPIVTLDARTVRSVEALVRWQHPERGLMAPAHFVPLAEETGLIVPLGRWVIRTACAQTAAWRRAHPGAAALGVSVNVAERQLRDPGLVADVRAALADAGLPAEALLLEITESALVQDPERARRTLDALKTLGVRLAIDDFGTGYSSLSYLQQFPVDVLKIDRAFVAAMAGDDRPTPATAPAAGDRLVRAIVHLGDSLGLMAVAEGVEHEWQAAALRALGCPLGQGYHFARPLDAARVPAALAAAGDGRWLDPSRAAAGGVPVLVAARG